MELEAKYTTQAKIDADLSGKESKKIVISNDAFAICEFMQRLMLHIKYQGFIR